MAKKLINDDITQLQAQGQLYISEIEAKVPWSLGVNAKNCLRRDGFLINFLPRITPELLERHSWKDTGDMERAISNDTRLMGQVAEEAIKDMDKNSGWTEAISDANQVKQDTRDLIQLIEIFHKYKYSDKELTPEQLRRHFTDYSYSSKYIKKQNDIIQATKEKYEQAVDSKEKMKALTTLRQEEEKLYSAHAAIAKAQFTLAANNNFDFLGKSQTGINSIESYAANLVEERLAKIAEMKQKYMDKYKAIPKFLDVYETLTKDLMDQLFLASEPNLDKYKLMVEKDVEQYISILKDAPNVILQCARVYPKLQQNLENEILFEKSANGQLNAELDPSNEFKARHEMPWPFTGMLGKQFETVLDSPSDKMIMSLVGPPGIGKTAMMEAMARQMGFLFKSISIPHCDSSLFGGLATITNQDQVKQLASQDMADAITDYGIIDLEEATAAPDNSVHLQMARFLQTGAIGINKQIHPLTVFVMTSNDDVMDNADIKPFSTVIMNRIDTLAMKNPQKLLNKWCSWVLHNPAIQGDPDAAETYNYIITFLKYDKNGKYYDGVSPESIQMRREHEGVANPSFRSWKNFADKIQMIIARRDLSVEERSNLIRKNGVGIIGPEATTAFAEHYIVSAKVPSIEELLKRMESATPRWTLADAVRVFDMGGNLKDNKAAKNRLQKKTVEEKDEFESAWDDLDSSKKKKFRYSLNLKKEDTERVTEAFNSNFRRQWENSAKKIAMNRWSINNPGKTFNPEQDNLSKEYEEIVAGIANGTIKNIPSPRTISPDQVFMPLKTLEENYNKIWGTDEIDINNSAVLFNLSGQISARVERLFEESYYNHTPIDGDKLNHLFTLAMTIPVKDFRSALVTDLYYKVFSNDKYEVYHDNGIKQRRTGGREVVLKLVPGSFTRRSTGEIVKVDKEAEKKQIEEAGMIPSERIASMISILDVLANVSNGFQMKDEIEKSWAKTQDAAGPSL